MERLKKNTQEQSTVDLIRYTIQCVENKYAALRVKKGESSSK